MIKQISIRTSKRNEFIDITEEVQAVVEGFNVKSGICYIYVPHTTAAVTINEGADPSVKRDILMMLEKLIPHRASYAHMEGNSDAHIKSSLVGASEVVIIEDGRLRLGTWQSVFFCEFDGPRSRRVIVKVIRD